MPYENPLLWQDWKNRGVWEAFLPPARIQMFPTGPSRRGFVPIDAAGNPVSVDGQTQFTNDRGAVTTVPTAILSLTKPGENADVQRIKQAIRTRETDPNQRQQRLSDLEAVLRPWLEQPQRSDLIGDDPTDDLEAMLAVRNKLRAILAE